MMWLKIYLLLFIIESPSSIRHVRQGSVQMLLRLGSQRAAKPPSTRRWYSQLPSVQRDPSSGIVEQGIRMRRRENFLFKLTCTLRGQVSCGNMAPLQPPTKVSRTQDQRVLFK